MKMLHDDDLIGYHPPKNPERSFRTIEFQPDWLDEEGLPTRMAAWVEANVEPNTLLVGARILSPITSKHFMIEGPAKNKDNGYVSPFWRATFELQSGNRMQVTPGSIEILDMVSHRLIRRYFEYLIEGGTTWKKDLELQLQRLRNYHDCPAKMGHALAHIDHMAHSLTGFRHGKIDGLIQMLGTNQYQDRECSRLTHPNVIKMFEYVRELYHAFPLAKRDEPNERLFQCIKESCRRIGLEQEPFQLLHRATPESEPTLVLPEGFPPNVDAE